MNLNLRAYNLARKSFFWLVLQKLPIFLIILSLVPGRALAQQTNITNINDWDNVILAEKSGEVIVKKKDGKLIKGEFGSLTVDTLSLIITRKRFFSTKQEILDIPKNEVREVRIKISEDSARIIGGAVGAGVGLGVGLGVESQMPSNDGKGILTIGLVAVGGLIGVSTGALVQSFKKGKLIYKSN